MARHVDRKPNIEDLLEREIPHLTRYALHLAGRPDEAEDLVQACLERALIYRERWDTSRQLRPWLFRIQHNIFMTWMRHRSRERHYLFAHPHPYCIGPGSEAALELDSVFHALENDLPPAQVQVLNLVAIEGYSYEEASEVLSVPVGTIRSRLFRCRETLRTART